MPAYDESCSPPAPMAMTTLRSEVGTFVNVPMLLDTGADLTLVPREAIDRLGLSPIPNQQFELQGFDGSRLLASIVILDLIFAEKVFRGHYLIADDSVGVIGRNVLNHLSIEFDGPALKWNMIR